MAEKSRKSSLLHLFVIFFIGLIIRLIFIPQPGFEADIAYWKWWGDEAAKVGAAAMIMGTGINYPPFFAFVLELIGRLYYLLGGTKETLFNVNNLLFLFLAKILPILTDLGTAFLIYKLCKNVILNLVLNEVEGLIQDPLNDLLPLLAATLYLFNPVIIFDSAFWGQTDSIAAFLTLLLFYLFLKQKIWLAYVVATIALFTKVQTVIFIPILILLTIKNFGVKKVVEGAFVSTATAYIINLPYILAQIMPRVLSMVIDSASYFPLASLNAYNIWWIVTCGAGFTTSDHILIGDIIPYKTAGLLLFSLAYALACMYLLWSDRLPNFAKLHFLSADALGKTKFALSEQNLKLRQNFGRLADNHILTPLFLTCALISFAFYMLPTEIHERYIFPIFMFITLLFPYFYKTKFFIFYFLFFIFLTLSIFINLHLVLVLNYPDNGFPILSALNQPPIYLPLTLLLSIINLIMFIIFIIVVLKSLSLKTLIASISPIVLILLSLLAINFFSSQKKEISLVDLKPVFASQEYKTLQKNRSVEGNNLSSAYYFYKEGLGSHANSQLTYNLAGRYKRFITDFGVDTEAGENASVEFVILLDKKVIFKSPVFKKWTTPNHVDLNVSSGKTMDLIITDANDGRNGDHADWLQPKLFK